MQLRISNFLFRSYDLLDINNGPGSYILHKMNKGAFFIDIHAAILKILNLFQIAIAENFTSVTFYEFSLELHENIRTEKFNIKDSFFLVHVAYFMIKRKAVHFKFPR